MRLEVHELIAIRKMRQYMIVLGNILALSVPDEGYSLSVPDEGYSLSVPDEGYSLSVPDEGYSRNPSCPLHLISTVLLLSPGWFLCWWTFSPRGYYSPNIHNFREGIIRPVFIASALTWFIRNLSYRNLQFLNHIILLKLWFSPLRYRWPQLIFAILFRIFGFLAPKILMLFRFQIYWLRTYPMKVITEMRCTQYIRYLRFYYQTADNQLIAFAKLCWQGRRFRYFSFTWIKLGIRYFLLKNEHRFNLHNIWHGLLMNTWVAVSLLVFIVYFNHFSAISWLPDIG